MLNFLPIKESRKLLNKYRNLICLDALIIDKLVNGTVKIIYHGEFATNAVNHFAKGQWLNTCIINMKKYEI